LVRARSEPFLMVAAGMCTIPRAPGNYIINRDITPYALGRYDIVTRRGRTRARARARRLAPLGGRRDEEALRRGISGRKDEWRRGIKPEEKDERERERERERGCARIGGAD